MPFVPLARTAPPRTPPWLAAVVLAAALTAACSSESNSQPPAKVARAPHLVEIVAVQQEAAGFAADREGTLRAVREVKLFNQEEGRVVEIRAREGDRVRAGQVLVRLDDTLLAAELDKAAATTRQAELDVNRLTQLTAKKLVTEDALSRAHTNLEIARAQERVLRTRRDYLTITAPFTSEVAMRALEPGDVAPKHSHLMTLIDLSTLVTDVNVSELLLPLLKVGDRAEVRIDALGEERYAGSIARIYPTVDPSTRRGRIEVALQPAPAGARPGQFCRVTLYPAGGSASLLVHHAAVRRDAQGEHVYVFVEDAGAPGTGTVRRTPVRSGVRLADRVEIRDGLGAGERVVIKGFLGLVDGQSVATVNAAPVVPRPEDAPPTRAAPRRDA